MNWLLGKTGQLSVWECGSGSSSTHINTKLNGIEHTPKFIISHRMSVHHIDQGTSAAFFFFPEIKYDCSFI